MDVDTRPMIAVREVEKRYGAGFALAIPEMDVDAGEVLGLLGPTGAGKSTLLRLFSGLQVPDSGVIEMDGRPVRDMDFDITFRRRLAMVHQHPLLLTRTVRWNVEYGLQLRGLSDRQPRVDAVLDELGLTDFAWQAARSLSGGQTQLVALARALVIEPEVLLLDEPTAHLDPASVARVEASIQRVRQSRRMTVVWATHNLFQVRRMATRAAVMLNGNLVELAATETLFNQPSDPRTADFLEGRMIY